MFVMDSVAYDPQFTDGSDELIGMYSYTDTAI